LVIVIHNFIIGFVSNGAAIALVACVFIVNLNNGLLHVKDVNIQRFNNLI
jgi:hypothetical protein